MPLSLESLIESMVDAGRTGDFDSIGRLPGGGIHREVLAFSTALRERVRDKIAPLSAEDRVALAKAVAVYEHSVGGVGSVTALQELLRFVDDPDGAVLDWILSNTKSYRYYSFGASSLVELRSLSAARAAATAANLVREEKRKEAAKLRRARRATVNLFNAVRRGDSRAVDALLKQGATVTAGAPDGTSLIEYASLIGRTEIADQLRSHVPR